MKKNKYYYSLINYLKITINMIFYSKLKKKTTLTDLIVEYFFKNSYTISKFPAKNNNLTSSNERKCIFKIIFL